MRVAVPFPRFPNQAPEKAVRFGALRAPPDKCQLVPTHGHLPIGVALEIQRPHLLRLVDNGRSFIFVDIAAFAWCASPRNRGGRSSVARREIHRPRAYSGCKLPPARADHRPRQPPPLPCGGLPSVWSPAVADQRSSVGCHRAPSRTWFS
jgi:hypothetical protein